MKFTLAWLKEHLETEAPVAEIGRALTMLGLEVEAIDDRAAALAPFTVAYVVSAEPHPQADRLRVCRVDTGGEVLQVVCGAPNARTGMKGVFARSGTTIPRTGLLLKKSIIRGVESNGMLCSAYEMGISDDHEGIIDLPADAPVGKPFAELMGLQDPVFDIKALANRPDCQSVRGIARDLAAAGIGRLKPLDVRAVPGRFPSPVHWRRDFPADAMDACPLVVGRYFRNVRNGPSPKWLQDRLTAIGLRPISALVDITNLLTYDLGRPLHAYDADKIHGGELVIRFARPGESFLALNGKSYALEPDMVAIGDAEGVDDLAGIMGGERTSCSESTTNMFLEAAIFDPVRVAATGRRLGLTSDARYRFERGLDQTSPFWGTEIATRLVLELCGGEASEITVEGAETAWRRQIPLRLARVAALGGVAVPVMDKRRILGDLGFEVSPTSSGGEGDVWQVTPPPWRGDIEGEADLVEEILRVHGYDNIPVVPLVSPTALPVPAVTPAQRRVSQAKRFLATRGLTEAVTFSFLQGKQAELFGGGQAALRLVNPISADLDVMRPTPLPNLIAAAGRNADRGLPDQALFEVGPAYADASPKGQSLIAAGIRVGQSGPRHWRERARPVDAYDVKADAVALLAACGLPVENLQQAADAPSWYHPGRSATLRIGPMLLARFGEIHPAVLQAMDVRGPIAAFEVILSAVPLPKARKTATRALAKLAAFQPVERDFAFLVDDAVPADKLVRAARGVDKALIADVQVFDVYRGEGVGAGRKSVAIAVRLQPAEATLTEAEIEAVAGRIVAAVTQATGAELRK
jgi:phenylalanyl-tRNA synthetase beta chain